MDNNKNSSEKKQNESITLDWGTLDQKEYEEEAKDTTLFECVDKTVLTLFNEPSLGLYYTQQHIKSTFPRLLYYMDNLYDNRKKMEDTVNQINNTIRDLRELNSLNEAFSFKMLAKIKSIDYAIKNK